MLINELAQWAVLVLLTVVVLGLLRQLGHFIVPRREELLYRGPEVGGDLPRQLLSGVQANGLRRAIAESRAGIGVVVVLNENCSGCKALLNQLEVLGSPLQAPLVAVVDSPTTESHTRLLRIFDHLVVDPGGGFARNAGILATPFVLAIDAELRVRHRAISGGLHELMEEWTGMETSDAQVPVETRLSSSSLSASDTRPAVEA